ncbi:hypothetical protein [Akkermansia muciniphila]|uniref:hypothetical protein n=1 Tax=Akkermansia muciniphila TaxID=239935 RepID=UPI00068CEE91|nr:hypothetical protein [Akkermansia muciniphila]
MATTPSSKKLTPFHVRNKDLKKDTATLFIRIHTRKIDVLISTLLQVEVNEWLKATASPRAWLAHQKKNYQLHAKLTQIEGIVKAHMAKIDFDREALDMDVRYISEPEKVEAERRAKEEAAAADRKAINRALIMREKLRNHGYMEKVVNKHLTNLKALINAAFIDGVHDNQRAASLIVKNKIEDRDKAVEIYLTETELQALYEMPLTGKNDHIRDVFLIGCYTCQRVSDYNNLNADCFETTRKGTRIIRIVQQKTKTEVTIPVLNENLITICEKYGYNVPKANEQG